MTGERRDELKRIVDRLVRMRVQLVCPGGWANGETGYRRGCRCRLCTDAMVASRAARKRRARALRQAAA